MAQEQVTVLVETSLPNERLDVYLRLHFPDVSRGAFQRLISGGNILVNGNPVKPTHPPRAGDLITVVWPEPTRSTALPQELPLDILYEDADLLVINKAAGMVVHPAVGHQEGTLVNALLHHCAGQLSGIGGVGRPGIVHRLDKDTSGCLVVAKNDAAHIGLTEQFAGREVEKTYHALVCGTLKSPVGEIRGSIARHAEDRKKMAVTKTGGRESWTSYSILEQFRAATLVEATLHTGRTHQIRVHFQSIGNPVAGDEVYGPKQTLHLSRSPWGAQPKRQMLHSYALSFIHPVTKQKMTFEAPLPADFEEVLATLRRA